jgi:hypothetical protein
LLNAPTRLSLLFSLLSSTYLLRKMTEPMARLEIFAQQEYANGTTCCDDIKSTAIGKDMFLEIDGGPSPKKHWKRYLVQDIVRKKYPRAFPRGGRTGPSLFGVFI